MKDRNKTFRLETSRLTEMNPTSVARTGVRMGTGPSGRADDDYLVVVVNRCNWVIVALLDQAGNAHPYNPPILRTCASDYQTCVKNGQYAILSGSKCNDAPYQFALRCHHPKGYTGDTKYVTINPDCSSAGEIIDFDIPDPA
jgi:hypothetical protein